MRAYRHTGVGHTTPTASQHNIFDSKKLTNVSFASDGVGTRAHWISSPTLLPIEPPTPSPYYTRRPTPVMPTKKCFIYAPHGLADKEMIISHPTGASIELFMTDPSLVKWILVCTGQVQSPHPTPHPPLPPLLFPFPHRCKTWLMCSSFNVTWTMTTRHAQKPDQLLPALVDFFHTHIDIIMFGGITLWHTVVFLFFFGILYILLSQWEFSHGKFGSLSPRKASCN